MNEKLTEQYYRCDFETSKLLKEAGFYLPCVAFTFIDGLNENRVFYGSAINHNADQRPFEPKLSIPLISVAKEWLKEKGYRHNYFGDIFFNGQKTGFSMLKSDYHKRNEAFIQTCCKHIIENK